MTQLPVVKPKNVIKALERAGFRVVRRKGSHAQLFHPDKQGIVTVALHTTELKRGTLKSILKQACLTVDEFFELLKK